MPWMFEEAGPGLMSLTRRVPFTDPSVLSELLAVDAVGGEEEGGVADRREVVGDRTQPRPC